MFDKQSSEYMCDINMTFINSSQLIYICVIVKRTLANWLQQILNQPTVMK